MRARGALQAARESARRVAGVATVALRAAVRTRLVLALLALLAVCVTLLPGVVKGDGTPEGQQQILLAYTLGFSFGLLCLATLWSACALFAAEIDSRRMALEAVKPVRPVEFWLGKWLALLVLNAAALAAAYGAVYAQLRWRGGRQGWTAGERPLSRRVARPLLPTPAEEARQLYRQMLERNEAPAGMSARQILRTLEERALDRYDVVNPGERVTWRFRVARPAAPGEAVTVRVRFDTIYSTREHVTGVCALASPQRPGRAVEVALDDFTLNEIAFDVDPRAFDEGVPRGAGAPAEPLRDFVLTFRHTGDEKKASALMLRFRQDVVLLTPGGSFEANMVRSALLQGSVLALLAAFGLTLSACFSLPVAAFVATVLLVLTLVGNAVVQVVAEEDERQAWNLPGIWVSRVVHAATRHAMKDAPLASLARGERLDGHVLADALVWNGCAVPLVFAALACGVLSRREWAGGA